MNQLVAGCQLSHVYSVGSEAGPMSVADCEEVEEVIEMVVGTARPAVLRFVSPAEDVVMPSTLHVTARLASIPPSPPHHDRSSIVKFRRFFRKARCECVFQELEQTGIVFRQNKDSGTD